MLKIADFFSLFYLGECSKLEFKCANGRCVWHKLVKDGTNDCGDNSDEAGGGCT